jgi:hypothetical protein
MGPALAGPGSRPCSRSQQCALQSMSVPRPHTHMHTHTPRTHPGALSNYLRKSSCRATRYKSLKLLLMVTLGRLWPARNPKYGHHLCSHCSVAKLHHRPCSLAQLPLSELSLLEIVWP